MDHIFIFPSGQGSKIFPSSPLHLKHSIFLVAEGDRSKNHTDPFKDIVVPGYSAVKPERQGKNTRDILAVFRGSTIMSVALQDGRKVKIPNELRISLMSELRESDNIIFTDQFSKAYVQELFQAKFIICPRGITPWTRRVFDGMFAGAVPVIISDDIEFPFEADIDWSLFTVKVAEHYAVKPGFLTERLELLVHDGTYSKKVRYLHEFRHNFDWNQEDVLNGILWQLYRKRRLMKHGSLRFWD